MKKARDCWVNDTQRDSRNRRKERVSETRKVNNEMGKEDRECAKEDAGE